MIRFNCAGCQKILNAPDEKAGMRFACPGCRTPVVVPAASTAGAPQPLRPSQQGIAPTRPSSQGIAPNRPSSAGLAAAPRMQTPMPAPDFSPTSDAPPASLGQKLVGEVTGTIGATFRQTLKPITLVFEIARRNRLRRKASDTQFALGQRVYEAQMGDKKIRARIQSLGERIHSIQDVKGDAREATAERRGLILQLAEPALAAENVPEAIAGEHERAREARAKFQAKDAALGGAFGGLLPPNGTAWRRVITGYTLTALMLFSVGGVYWLATSGSRAARARELAMQAANQDADQQRQADEADWAKEKNAEQIVEKCGPSVARISFKLGKKEGGGGTGFVVRPGVIATNAHVIEDALGEELSVFYPSAKDINKTAFPAKVIYFDRKRDLAFLAVEPKVPVLRIADKFEFRSGKQITIIGCPGLGATQLENAVSTGVLSTKTEVEKIPYYQLGAAVNPGNSGGPVFDNKGQIIGVVTLKSTMQESIAFCIPWQDFKDRLDSLEKEDPHRTAAAAQALHNVHAVGKRTAMTAFVYVRVMSAYAGAMRESAARGRPPEEGVSRAKPLMDELLRRVGPFLVDAKLQTVGRKILTDPNLTPEVRSKFGEVWKTYEELKQQIERPTGNPTAYATKLQQLDRQVGTSVSALQEALGFEKPTVEDDF
ncbi:MAG: trypsin-like peptidase domain-containing protein [Planctomycetia bacterium]|nr:trypsin-like peptidase domain-containing protein [Planctomycetia bacterium]